MRTKSLFESGSESTPFLPSCNKLYLLELRNQKEKLPADAAVLQLVTRHFPSILQTDVDKIGQHCVSLLASFILDPLRPFVLVYPVIP